MVSMCNKTWYFSQD